ncbi:MAG: hypothetical protein QNJ54_30655 [Prochloraceae cyanobacterium]|nr:hypothetical protein [Prochloraceae cyanobacterium]
MPICFFLTIKTLAFFLDRQIHEPHKKPHKKTHTVLLPKRPSQFPRHPQGRVFTLSKAIENKFVQLWYQKNRDWQNHLV